MKQLGQFIAIICGQTVLCAWTIAVITICKRNSWPRVVEGTLMAGAAIAAIWCCLKLLKMAQQAETYEEDLSYANYQAKKWFTLYEQTCRALESTNQELSATEDELFDLQQAHSELGTAYNDLRDILLENGIDPDSPCI